MTVYYDLPKPVVVHECPDCGREAGHHLGCPKSNQPAKLEPEVEEAEGVDMDEVDNTEIPVCLAEGCQDAPKPYGGRGPRPKYCAAHGK